jgi:6,7-dimethyl-8-ribityllumazine synthase
MKQAPQGLPDGRGLRVAVLHAAFNGEIVRGLVDGALAALAAMRVARSSIVVEELPGAFELPLAAAVAAESGRFDAIVALGAVIRGDTDHYDHVAREAATGLATVAREARLPVSFGVLTVTDIKQARRRAVAGPENKGGEAARAAVAAALALRRLSGARGTRRRIGARSRRSA